MVVKLEPGFAHVQQPAFPLRHDVMGEESGTESGSDPLTDGIKLILPGLHDLAVEMVQKLAINRGVLVVNRRVLLASGARPHVDCDTGGSDRHRPKRDVIRPPMVVMYRIDVAGVIARGIEPVGAKELYRPIRSHNFIGEHGHHRGLFGDELRHSDTRGN